MKKILTLSFILGFGFFYLYVLFLAFNPNVTPPYRFYFIDQTVRGWKNGKILDYTLGVPIDFTEKNISNISKKGWNKSEIWPNAICTFVKSSLPHLYFLQNSEQPPRFLVFTGSPLLLASPYSTLKQTLNVYLNDRLIFNEEIHSLDTVKIKIPADIASASKVLDFKFEYIGPGYKKTTFGQLTGFCFTEIKLE